jgi:hypothetical protein
MDPERISAELGETPYRSWKAGDGRRTPTGQVLEGLNDNTYWCSESIDGDGFDLASTIGSSTESLESHRSFLTDFNSAGGKVEYFIGWYIRMDVTRARYSTRVYYNAWLICGSIWHSTWMGLGQRVPPVETR